MYFCGQSHRSFAEIKRCAVRRNRLSQLPLTTASASTPAAAAAAAAMSNLVCHCISHSPASEHREREGVREKMHNACTIENGRYRKTEMEKAETRVALRRFMHKTDYT